MSVGSTCAKCANYAGVWKAHFPFSPRHAAFCDAIRHSWEADEDTFVVHAIIQQISKSHRVYSPHCTAGVSESCDGMWLEIESRRFECCANTDTLLCELLPTANLSKWRVHLSRFPRAYLIARNFHLDVAYRQTVSKEWYAPNAARFIARTALAVVVDFLALCGWQSMHRHVVEKIAMVMLNTADSDRLALTVFESYWSRARERAADVGVSIASRTTKRPRRCRRNKPPHP